MPCNCSGVRMRRCSCKVFGYPLAKSKTQNVVLVEEDPIIGATDDNGEKLNFFLRMFEHVYDKCAGYNLRYCSLRGRHKRDKHLANAVKDLIVLICFIVANFIVFLNISTRMAIHMYFVFREIVKYLERYTQVVVNRHFFKSQCDQAIMFNPRLHSE